jgi:GTP-binding protein EngB required for normal cell division
MSTDSQFLPTCDTQLKPIVASRSNSFTPRRAVDSSGRVGSFYDACCDQVLHNSNLHFVTKSVKSYQPSKCTIKGCETTQYLNLLERFNMHDELRLSVALQIVREMGVGGLINYSGPIDKYTRFISYTYYSRTDYLSDDDYKRLGEYKSSMSNTLATHVIVLVNWGINVVAALQLPSDDNLIERFDDVLERLCSSLSNNQTSEVLSQEDKSLLKKIPPIEVFSNISNLTRLDSIIDFYHNVPRIKNDNNLLEPYNYNLCPVKYFYDVNNVTQGIFNELGQEHIKRIEFYLLQLASDFKTLRIAIEQDYQNLERHIKEHFSEIGTRWSNLKETYKREIQRVRDLVVGFRRGEIKQTRLHEVTNNEKKEELMKRINDFQYDLDSMQEKERMIGNLIKKDFEYRNVRDYDVKQGDDEQTIEKKLGLDKQYERIICSDDKLYKNNEPELFSLHRQLLEERKEKSQLRIIYADFSYSSYELNRFIILPKRERNNNVDVPKPITTAPASERLKSDDIINILLLGESGAGKSTFINAFVNYLVSNELKQAQKKPIVLMPVSFVMTTGDDFQERTVTFGGMDTLSNEDHDHSGQSVTQHCKSYVFTLKHGDNKGKKLRIIDTPGIGDVRGSAQDDVNMQHILSYISNLTHLNAVCILMKPNNARLNIFFRSCLVQLFDLLSENARDKIIFCFTNARATFYSPGNTATLLKELLKSLPVKEIPFVKKNTFCFDSESFRYLVAVQNRMKFTDSEEEEYKDSWNKSSTESKRFVEYILTNMTTPLVPGECESMKDAQLKISLMIRPMLEAMRNNLRNIVLWNAGSHTVSIELRPRIIKSTTAICLKCPRESLPFGDFWITMDALHVFHNKCRTCTCIPNDHYPIDYEVGYELRHHSASDPYDDLAKMVDDLCETSAEFALFLFGATGIPQYDSFQIGINRMIKEEGDICTNKSRNHLNSSLLGELEKLKKNYEEARKKWSTDKEQIQLSNIYKKIRHVSNYPIIQLQIGAVKEWRKFTIKYYEHEVSV